MTLDSFVFTELAYTMKYGEGVLYNIVFTELPFKAVSGDVTAFHRILLVTSSRKNPIIAEKIQNGRFSAIFQILRL